jgi:hypothetical protein
MSNTLPPPAVAQAAATVQAWLDGQPPVRVSAEEYDRMSAAEKWDYARKFDQSQFLAPAVPTPSK